LKKFTGLQNLARMFIYQFRIGTVGKV